MNQAIVAFAALSISGAASVIAGVAILFGTGWALIAFGGCAFAGAAFIKRGAE